MPTLLSLKTIARFALLPVVVFILVFSFSFYFLSSPWQSRFSASPGNGFLQSTSAGATALISVSPAPLPVFPGAVGFGSDTVAGRGGTVYKVTNLNDSGTGSLRDCVEVKTGPRVCVFETSGTINITSNIKAQNPFLTIAGQTAPSPGIGVRGAALQIQTHDVVVQHMRFRAGDDPAGPPADDRDSIKILHLSNPIYNIVLDHVSASWSIDEVGSAYYDTVHDISILNSIISEGLHRSFHSGGAHSKGFLVGRAATRVSFIRNMMSHNNIRSPRFAGGSDGVVVNNVIYNWKEAGTNTGSGHLPDLPVNIAIVGNVYIKGVDTALGNPGAAIWVQPGISTASQYYLWDNSIDGTIPADPWSPSLVQLDANVQKVGSSPLWPTSFTALQNSLQLQDIVLNNVGARPADRDAVDTRMVNDVKNRTGRMIDCITNCRADLYPGQTLYAAPGGLAISRSQHPHADPSHQPQR